MFPTSTCKLTSALFALSCAKVFGDEEPVLGVALFLESRQMELRKMIRESLTQTAVKE